MYTCIIYLVLYRNSLISAPPLTFDNVLDVVKNVQSWHTLGQHMYSRSLLNLDKRQLVSDEACLKAMIEGFLSGKGYYQQPSWRAVIWSLYRADETQLAGHIRSFAEPMQGKIVVLMMMVWHITQGLMPLHGSTNFL